MANCGSAAPTASAPACVPSQRVLVEVAVVDRPDVGHEADLQIGAILGHDRCRSGEDAGGRDGERQGCGGEPAHAFLLCVGTRTSAAPERFYPSSTTPWDGHCRHRSGFAQRGESAASRSLGRGQPAVTRTWSTAASTMASPPASTASSSMATRCPPSPPGSGLASDFQAGLRLLPVAGDVQQRAQALPRTVHEVDAQAVTAARPLAARPTQ